MINQSAIAPLRRDGGGTATLSHLPTKGGGHTMVGLIRRAGSKQVALFGHDNYELVTDEAKATINRLFAEAGLELIEDGALWKEGAVMGSHMQSADFPYFVQLNGAGCFVQPENRVHGTNENAGCFTMHVNSDALTLLASHKAHMRADGTLTTPCAG